MSKITSIHDKRYIELISKLAEMRKESGMSQLNLAKSLGLSQPDISKIERCERRLDALEFLDIIRIISDHKNLSSQEVLGELYENFCRN